MVLQSVLALNVLQEPLLVSMHLRLWYSQCLCWFREIKGIYNNGKKRWLYKTFWKIGEGVALRGGNHKVYEGFVCQLYGYSEMKDINMLRYRLFCPKKGDCHYVKLPPRRSSLKQHCLWANYQSKIWRDCIADELFVPTPEGHGWTITYGEISIKWMDCKPAPEEVSVVFFMKEFSVFS